MNESDYPALYRAADQLSKKAQAAFYLLLRVHLIALVVAAALSVLNYPHSAVAIAQALALLTALASSIYLGTSRPDKTWYGARAVAESAKTLAWRFASRAEPFQASDEDGVRMHFRQTLRAVVEQNSDIASKFEGDLSGAQISRTMDQMRKRPLAERKAAYVAGRVEDQLNWYERNANQNRRKQHKFFAGLVTLNAIALVLALIKIWEPDLPYWPTDVFIAGAASLISWTQAKRYSDLATSYALAANEISFIREQAERIKDDEAFSTFVGDAENAFSREHTQWVARKDK